MKKIYIGLSALGGLIFTLPVFAADLRRTVIGSLNYATVTGLGSRDFREVVFQIVNVLLGFLGIVAIIIIMWGGFKWMTAQGEEGKVDEAKKMIVAGVIGLTIIFISYALARFVMLTLVNVTR